MYPIEAVVDEVVHVVIRKRKSAVFLRLVSRHLQLQLVGCHLEGGGVLLLL